MERGVILPLLLLDPSEGFGSVISREIFPIGVAEATAGQGEVFARDRSDGEVSPCRRVPVVGVCGVLPCAFGHLPLSEARVGIAPAHVR